MHDQPMPPGIARRAWQRDRQLRWRHPDGFRAPLELSEPVVGRVGLQRQNVED